MILITWYHWFQWNSIALLSKKIVWIFLLNPILWALTSKKYNPIHMMPQVCLQNFRLVPRKNLYYALPPGETEHFLNAKPIHTYSEPCRSLTLGSFQITVWPPRSMLSRFPTFQSSPPSPFCYVYGKPYDDFCQIKSIMLTHWFVHHKLNTIGLKVWVPGCSKPS